MLDIEYYEEQDGKRVLLKVPYDVAKIFLYNILKIMNEPVPIGASNALITIGDATTIIQMEIKPPASILQRDCKADRWHQGVCGLCNAVDEITRAPYIGKDICEQCFNGLVTFNLLGRMS